MGLKSNENLFKDYFIKSSNVVVDTSKIKRQSSGTPTHLRFHLGSGISNISTLLTELKRLKLDYQLVDKFTRTPNYKGNGVEVQWNNCKVGLLVANHNKGGVNRKQYTPDALKLNGSKFTTSKELRDSLNESLNQDKRKDLLFALLDNIEFNTPLPNFSELSKEDKNRISCDFGEVIVAFYKLIKKETVYFPKGSNNPLVDIVTDKARISVKGHNAFNNINLTKFKNSIDTSSDIGMFLYSLASHNREMFLKMGFKVCTPLTYLKEWIGGDTLDDLKDFVNKVSYDDFYSYIKHNDEFKSLGIPLKSEKPRALWQVGDLNPIFFTLNTLISNLWTDKQNEEISKIINNLSLDITYIQIQIDDKEVLIKETKSSAYQKWTTKYWSRAYAAFHNWMGAVAVK